MKYWDLVNVSNVGSKTSLPTSTTNAEDTTIVPTEPFKSVEDRVNMILDAIEEHGFNSSNESGYPETTLNEEEAEHILSILMDFEKKYFSSIPMTDKLSGSFIWNIPKHVYTAIKDAEDYMLPDALNPLYWFYIMCTDVPKDMIGKFVTIALNSISDEDLCTIEKHADEYDAEYLTTPADDEEDEIEVDSDESEDNE